MLKPKLFVAFSSAVALMAITFVGTANQPAKIDPEIEKLLIQKRDTL